jgi:hypothetical protein
MGRLGRASGSGPGRRLSAQALLAGLVVFPLAAVIGGFRRRVLS